MTTFWIGGRLVSANDAVVSVLDHGLTVGDGVFETLLVREGLPSALTRHLIRLRRSADGLGIGCPPEDVIHAAIDEVVAAAGTEAVRARLRVTVTSGPGPLGSERGHSAPTLVVTLTATDPWGPTTTIATVPWTRNEHSAVAGIKTTSYAENAVALAHAHSRGASEAVLANTRGQLCEGTGTNVFVVIDGEVHTPALASGCLAGITRELELEWGSAIAAHHESELPYDILQSADEIFVTSSTRDVHPVVRVDDRDLAVGPVSAALVDHFAMKLEQNHNP